MTDMYEEIKEKFEKTEKLYHYTSFETTCKIIASSSLKYGLLKDMNDINESYRPLFWEKVEGFDEKSFKDELKEIKQLSFSIDYKQTKGFDIPAMWGHYANKGRGICLVFDKSIIEKSTKDKSKFCSGRIKYTQDTAYIDCNKVKINTGDYLWNNKKELFFKKTKDWSYEQEYRIIAKDVNKFFEFENDALLAVIMCYPKRLGKDKRICLSVEAQKIHTLLKENIPLVELDYHGIMNNWETSLTEIYDGYTLWPNRKVKIDTDTIVNDALGSWL